MTPHGCTAPVASRRSPPDRCHRTTFLSKRSARSVTSCAPRPSRVAAASPSRPGSPAPSTRCSSTASKPRAPWQTSGRAALLAVGGYGRGTLAYGSDLDLVLLVDDPEAPAVAPFTEALLHPLWDGGIAVGHAVRSVDDFVALARTDIRTATTVLDARCVAGDAGLRARRGDALCERALRRRPRALSRRAHRGDVVATPPLRRHGVPPRARREAQPRRAPRRRHRAVGAAGALRRGELRRGARSERALSRSERDALDEAQEFLWRVRSLLHARSRRRSDRLAFDEQEEAAVEPHRG